MSGVVSFFTKQLSFGNFSLPFTYWQAIAIVFLLFLLVLMMSQFRRHYIDWSLKGAIFGIFFGFILALILEGFLIVSGRTALIGLLGWEKAPKPLSVALDAGREKVRSIVCTP